MRVSRLKYIFVLIICFLMIGSTVVTLEKPELKQWPNTLIDQFLYPVTKVGIQQSNKENASQIEYNEIKNMVATCIEIAGGLSGIIENGDIVVLKPNLVTKAPLSQNFEITVNGVTTDWRVTKAVAEIVRELNPDGKIYVLEGSLADGKEMMDSLNYGLEYMPEIDAFYCLEDISGGWEDWNSDSLIAVSLPDSISLYPDYLKPNNSREIYLNRLYYECDVLISIPVLKNHESAGFTGALKNVGIGATPTNIYGLSPTNNLRWPKIDHGTPNLNKWIHDFNMCRSVDFVVMDGLQGLENGPFSKNIPVIDSKKNMRLILAGHDAVAVDAIASLIIGIDPSKVDHIVQLHNDLIGCADRALIRVEGKMVHEVKEIFNHTKYAVTSIQYSDYTSPQLDLISYDFTGDSLFLQLTVDPEVLKIEFVVDGNPLETSVINNFENITLYTGDWDSGQHEIEIYAFDVYLNCTQQSLDINTRIAGGASNIIETFQLLQNYPNPFNSRTVIQYQLPIQDYVKMIVYDVTGREVITLVDELQTAGLHQTVFEATDQSTGLYFYTLKTTRFSQTNRLLFLK